MAARFQSAPTAALDHTRLILSRVWSGPILRKSLPQYSRAATPCEPATPRHSPPKLSRLSGGPIRRKSLPPYAAQAARSSADSRVIFTPLHDFTSDGLAPPLADTRVIFTLASARPVAAGHASAIPAVAWGDRNTADIMSAVQEASATLRHASAKLALACGRADSRANLAPLSLRPGAAATSAAAPALSEPPCQCKLCTGIHPAGYCGQGVRTMARACGHTRAKFALVSAGDPTRVQFCTAYQAFTPSDPRGARLRSRRPQSSGVIHRFSSLT